MPVTHQLKTWRQPFQRTWDGCQDYEVRAGDRPFQVGDELVLMEWNEKDREYMRRRIFAEVTGITGEYLDSNITERRPSGLMEGFVVLGIVIKKRQEMRRISYEWEWKDVNHSTRWEDDLKWKGFRWGLLVGAGAMGFLSFVSKFFRFVG